LDDLGDFLETVLGIDDLDGGSDSYEDLDEEALNLELKDAELVVEQLQQRMERLKADGQNFDSSPSSESPFPRTYNTLQALDECHSLDSFLKGKLTARFKSVPWISEH